MCYLTTRKTKAWEHLKTFPFNKQISRQYILTDFDEIIVLVLVFCITTRQYNLNWCLCRWVVLLACSWLQFLVRSLF
jgi:hypothetical protein